MTFQGARRISQESIDAIVCYRKTPSPDTMYRTNGSLLIDIHSPYRLEGPFLNPLSMQVLGDPRQRVRPTDPMTWIEADEVKRLGQTVLFGPESTLARLPFHPFLHAQDS